MSLFLRSSVALLTSMLLVGATQALELDTTQKKLSYTLGYQYIQQFQMQGTMIDMEAFSAAVSDVQQGDNLRMSKEEMGAAMKSYREGLDEDLRAKAEARLQAGQEFLEKNKSKPGVVVLPSGLQYIEHRAGNGASPSMNSMAKLNYRGTLIDGMEFDSSKPGEPDSFELKGVIRGLAEAITMMKPGAQWTVFIPTRLAYGIVGSGQKIGPNEALIFELELISVE
ncbi:MAG: FKBP-type peptidyl-prolyl cis-trans isomerase [Gammaproteobacteria bacterium]|nr:FKBP-type peptidyl-prolyl cis-trans isomerase [Gammaproteobacteria bacterium]HXK55214.1 FKBP-type peptidyl-prolyl cis-trans isomerase [Gammaproteobacteria bacterium]